MTGSIALELRRESDASLFRMMVAAEKAPEKAQAALGEVHQRHVDALYRYCCGFARPLGGDSGIQDLVQDTFIRAFDRAKTYRPDEALEPSRERKKTARWLRRIATRLFLDLRDRKIRDRAVRSAEWHDLLGEELRQCSTYAHEIEGGIAPGAEARRALAHRALSALAERDRYIVLISLDWYDRTRRTPFRVPRDIIEGICEKYGITAHYYRQIRGRAMKQLARSLTVAA